MFAQYAEGGYSLDGRRAVYARIIASEEPSVLPRTGADVENLIGTDSEDCVFWPGSYIFVTDTAASSQLYMADESGEFVPQ